jgi:hypothetical protein
VRLLYTYLARRTPTADFFGCGGHYILFLSTGEQSW